MIAGLARKLFGSSNTDRPFMGLTGPLGVLPLAYTELVMERLRARDTTLRDFYDVFNHRMISLFYQAWEKYRFQIPYERGERDRFSHHVLALLGLGTPGLEDRQDVPDDSLLFYSGLLASHARSATGLRQLLEDYFGVAVEKVSEPGRHLLIDPVRLGHEVGPVEERPGHGETVLPQDPQFPEDCLPVIVPPHQRAAGAGPEVHPQPVDRPPISDDLGSISAHAERSPLGTSAGVGWLRPRPVRSCQSDQARATGPCD